ncbi:MAG: hypothetical protein BMS9Abin13_236 [Patescibacteria group bacterium]|nr:MAG: hypothetical protein BMS9Abin13_236 [Patescibacteria group bacterium]
MGVALLEQPFSVHCLLKKEQEVAMKKAAFLSFFMLVFVLLPTAQFALADTLPEHQKVPLEVSSSGRYFVKLQMVGGDNILALVDTGFTGTLVIPVSLYDTLKSKGMLRYTGKKVTMTMADKSIKTVYMYRLQGIVIGHCMVKNVNVYVLDGAQSPVLGMRILRYLRNTNITFGGSPTLSFTCPE